MTVEELNAITAQFGELFKHYLANPIFRQNIDFLMKVPIQQKDTQNMLTTLDLVAQKYQYELRNSKEPWKPNILDKDASLDLIATPPCTGVSAASVMANVILCWGVQWWLKNIILSSQRNFVLFFRMRKIIVV